jgi:hypothetical protein
MLCLVSLALQSCGQDTTQPEMFPLTVETLSVAGIGTRLEATQLSAEGGEPNNRGYKWTLTPGKPVTLPRGLVLSKMGALTGDLARATGGVPFNCPGSSEVCGQAYTFAVTVTDFTNTADAEVTIYDFIPGTEQCGVCDDPTVMVLDTPDVLAVAGKLQEIPTDITSFDLNQNNFGSHTDHGFYPDGAPKLAPTEANIPAGIPFGLEVPIFGGTPPYLNWHLTAGSLPPGLTLNAQRGVILGQPLAEDIGKTYMFSIGADDSAHDVTPDAFIGQVMVTESITITSGGYVIP